jgi:hypothetical protein
VFCAAGIEHGSGKKGTESGTAGGKVKGKKKVFRFLVGVFQN